MDRSDVEEDTGQVAKVFRETWMCLPALLVGSLLACVVALLGSMVSPGLTPISLLVFGAFVLPVLVAMMWFVKTAVEGGSTRVSTFLLSMPWVFKRVLPATLIPSVLGSIALLAWQVWMETASPLSLVPLGMSATGTVLSALATVVAAPLRLLMPRIRWRRCWLVSLMVVARSPVPIGAVIVVNGVGIWSSTEFSAGILLLLPLLLAPVWVLAAIPSIARAGCGQRAL